MFPVLFEGPLHFLSYFLILCMLYGMYDKWLRERKDG